MDTAINTRENKAVTSEQSLAQTGIQHSTVTKPMELLTAQNDLNYYFFNFDSMPTKQAIVDLTNDSWLHDYAKNGQAIFKYDEEYLRWLLQKNTFDGIWVTKSSGEPVGLLILTKRTTYFNGQSIPSYYATLLAVAKEFRKSGVGRKIMNLLTYTIAPREDRLVIGAMDGESNGKKLSDKFFDTDREKGNLPYWQVCSNSRPLWAATEDMALLHKYMPLAGIIAKIALNPLVRKLIEFNYRAFGHKDYTVELVPPFGLQFNKSFKGTGFAMDPTLETLYSPEHKNVAGVYRVTFASLQSCEIYYNIHTVTKVELDDAIIGHIQLIDAGTASNKQVARALQIVNNELFRRGAITILIQNLGMVSVAGLIKAGFLPSDRKIKFYVGCCEKTAPRPVNLLGKLYVELT